MTPCNLNTVQSFILSSSPQFLSTMSHEDDWDLSHPESALEENTTACSKAAEGEFDLFGAAHLSHLS